MWHLFIFHCLYSTNLFTSTVHRLSPFTDYKEQKYKLCQPVVLQIATIVVSYFYFGAKFPRPIINMHTNTHRDFPCLSALCILLSPCLLTYCMLCQHYAPGPQCLRRLKDPSAIWENTSVTCEHCIYMTAHMHPGSLQCIIFIQLEIRA